MPFPENFMRFDFIRTLPQRLLPKQALTIFAGFLANCTIHWIKNFLITDFITRFSVDMRLAKEEDPRAYASFNDFFIRHLKAQYRPIAPGSVVSPVDGVISQLGRLHHGQFVQAKGHAYAVDELLMCPPDIAQLFYEGQFATFYLSPKDYHRIHMPLEGTLRDMLYVPGELFSVQPKTAMTIPKLFARNERLVIFFDTQYGLMAMVMVGAVIVGAMNTVWHGDVFRSKTKAFYNYASLEERITLLKGEEMGHFKLGSTVILLFAKDASMLWNSSLTAGQSVIFGQSLVGDA